MPDAAKASLQPANRRDPRGAACAASVSRGSSSLGAMLTARDRGLEKVVCGCLDPATKILKEFGEYRVRRGLLNLPPIPWVEIFLGCQPS